jgi:hypothetical protein
MTGILEKEKNAEELRAEISEYESELSAVFKEIVAMSRYPHAADALCCTINYLFEQQADAQHQLWNLNKN